MKAEAPVKTNRMYLVFESDSTKAVKNIILELTFNYKTLFVIEVVGIEYLINFDLSPETVELFSIIAKLSTSYKEITRHVSIH